MTIDKETKDMRTVTLDLYERDADQPFFEQKMQVFDDLNPLTTFLVEVPPEVFKNRGTVRVFVTVEDN